jgi:hypothetical protein
MRQVDPVGNQRSDAGRDSILRRWFRFSLRSLFLVTTVLAIWLAFKVHAARQQREAVAYFLSVGGTLRYDHELDSTGKPIRNATPPGWPWLRNMLGSEYFDSARALQLSSKSVTDPGARHLTGLPTLKSLWLEHTQVGDESAASIGQLRMLYSLDLSSTGFTDAGLVGLRNLSNLTYLNLVGTKVSDAGVDSLLAMPSLYEVDLSGTRVSEAGVLRLVEAGKQVICSVNAQVTAVDESNQPTTVLRTGESVRLRGSFYVPPGAKPIRGNALFYICRQRPEPKPHLVIIQSGIVTFVQTGPTLYEFDTVEKLPPSNKPVMPGEIQIIGPGGLICIAPLTEIQPAAVESTTHQ